MKFNQKSKEQKNQKPLTLHTFLLRKTLKFKSYKNSENLNSLSVRCSQFSRQRIEKATPKYPQLLSIVDHPA